MSQVVNRHDAPASLVAFANAPHYDSGDSDLTVTQLIDAPRVRILREKHEDQIQDDVYENIFRLVGTAIHSIAEQHAGGVTTEERIFIEREGKKISGAIDVQYMNEDGTLTIGDYKFTSLHSLRFPEKWEQQLNLYAYLVENSGIDHPVVSRLEVYAILRDWTWRASERDREYPQTPGVTVEVKLWSQEEREAFFKKRLALHLLADSIHSELGGITQCTKEEMWEKDPTYAVRSTKRDKAAEKRGGTSRAIRVLNSEEDAQAYIDDSENEDFYIEERPGERTRCENFCDVAQFCDQRNNFNNERNDDD